MFAASHSHKVVLRSGVVHLKAFAYSRIQAIPEKRAENSMNWCAILEDISNVINWSDTRLGPKLTFGPDHQLSLFVQCMM